MYGVQVNSGFHGQRSAKYTGALSLYPDAWTQDIAVMQRSLELKEGEVVLDVGAGTGYFSRAIARSVGPSGHLVVTDPSIEQLTPLREELLSNVTVYAQSVDRLDLPIRNFDAIWSRGAMHHVFDKTSAFRCLAAHTRVGGRLVISDIFAGSQLAKYFDSFIGRSCLTGHEVAFLSREFADTLCFLTGWEKPHFHEVIIPWEFEELSHIGDFLKQLFAASESYSASDCFRAAESYLSVSPTRSGYVLMWPTTIMTTRLLPSS